MKIISRYQPTLTYAYLTGVKECANLFLLSLEEARAQVEKLPENEVFLALLNMIENDLNSYDFVEFE